MTWAEQVAAWSAPPVDDVGYVPAYDLLAMRDSEFLQVMLKMRDTRYGGWRNHDGRWRALFRLDRTVGQTVMDYGCGTGLETLEYARNQNGVVAVDISRPNLRVTERLLALYGYTCSTAFQANEVVTSELWYAQSLHVFHCDGVLHHSRHPRAVMEAAHRWLRPGGQARLMVYSDLGWRLAVGTEPPAEVTADPDFEKFVRYFDGVGDYADWYDEARLLERFGDLFDLVDLTYLTPDDRYLGAVLQRRS